ncbi:MAG: glutamine amidotransferase [Alphaproteobacteria bacterium]|nr:MAG: glutamine amidotransferase [Alphaproteobacteria bacterium]
MKKTALILRHSSSIHLGSVAEVLACNNYGIKHLDTFKDDIQCVDPLIHDIVIILGGAFGVYNQEEYPFIRHELEFLKKRITKDKPTLGICLGAQMIAAALGANVYLGKSGFDLGWAPLILNDKGRETPIRHLGSDLTHMFFSHGDTFDLPDGATLLASSKIYTNQAYSYGKNIIATQFHPEVDAYLVEELLSLLVGHLTGSNRVADIHQIRQDTKSYSEILKIQTSKFLNEWLQTVE